MEGVSAGPWTGDRLATSCRRSPNSTATALAALERELFALGRDAQVGSPRSTDAAWLVGGGVTSKLIVAVYCQQRQRQQIDPVPRWLAAGLWGLVAGGALVVGAGVAFFARVPRRLIAAVMAFGAGVLISALSFDLMEKAYERGGFSGPAIGFLAGAAVYTLAGAWLAAHGAKHRKRSGPPHPSEKDAPGSGLTIAVGALLDGIPESIVIGVTMIQGGAVSLAAVAAVFLSNVPEGLSSAAGMKRAGRSPAYIFGVWSAIAIVSALAAVAGYSVFRHFSDPVISATTGIAAGAILAMIADTMIPEAFEETHTLAGLITVAGFLAAFILAKLGG